jgi:hypothetical protein
MRTASPGLQELLVVRVNAGPLLVTSRAHPPFFVFFKKSFLANEQEKDFGGRTVKVWPLYGS